MSERIGFLAADWPVPDHIRAGTTLRRGGGVSAPPFDDLNLGDHVGDAPQAVSANRGTLKRALALPNEPTWLTQVHGTHVVDAAANPGGDADASVATVPGAVCAVLTADCLPVLFCDRVGSCWGAAHAGWRGLAAGVLEATVERLPAAPEQLLAWLGPAIGVGVFEVGQDVRETFAGAHAADAAAFTPCTEQDKYLADIYALARARLRRSGITRIYGDELCTASAPKRFYSHRRDGQSGRMASLVWHV